MRLSHKIRKLFSTDTLASLREHAGRWIHPVDAKRILATIDPAEIARITEHYPRRPGARKTNAWQDAAHWIDINVGRAQNLWLDRSPPLRILDLGSGAGYFLYVCQFLGHSGAGLDLDDDPFFGEMTKYFNVPRVIWRIDPGVPLPDLGEKFDLVTGHRVSPRNCAPVFWRKARAFFVRKPCWQPTQTIDRALNRFRIHHKEHGEILNVTS